MKTINLQEEHSHISKKKQPQKAALHLNLLLHRKHRIIQLHTKLNSICQHSFEKNLIFLASKNLLNHHHDKRDFTTLKTNHSFTKSNAKNLF